MDVLGFQVSMHYATLVNVADSCQHLVEHFKLCDIWHLFVSQQVVLKIITSHIFGELAETSIVTFNLKLFTFYDAFMLC